MYSYSFKFFLTKTTVFSKIPTEYPILFKDRNYKPYYICEPIFQL